MVGALQSDYEQQTAGRIAVIIVALELRFYSEVIGYAIQEMRPSLLVEVVSPDALHEEVERLEPRIILCSQPKPTTLTGRCVWIEYRRPYDEPTVLRINGQRREVGRSIELNDLLAAIDEFVSVR